MTTLILSFLLLALANALLINGLHKYFQFEVFQKDPQSEYAPGFPEPFDKDNSMIFGRIHYFFNTHLGPNFCKPLFACVPCMAGVHSLYVFWPAVALAGMIQPGIVLLFLVYIPVVSALSMVVNSVME